MKLFRNLGIVIALALGLMSCQQDEIGENNLNDGKGLCQINIGLQDLVMSRALSDQTTSAKGGLTNVDFAKYDLRYIIAIYDQEGNDLIVDPITKIYDQYSPTTVNFRLTPNRKYKIVAWADFVKQGETQDLHYNTSDLKNITCKDAPEEQLNDESRDAFTIVDDLDLGSESVNKDLVLRRPFAKLRIVATDWNVEGVHNQMPDSFKVTYYNAKRFNNYNAVSKESNYETLGELDKSQVYTGKIANSKEERYYKVGYDATPANRTLIVDYLMTDKEEQTPIHLKFETLDGNATVSTYDFKNNVPIQRNYLTTLLGKLLTVGAQINISIDESFIDEYNGLGAWFRIQGFMPTKPQTHAEGDLTVYEIKTPEDLMWVSENPMTGAKNVFRLYSDIDMEGVDWMPIGMRNGAYGGPQGTFDGQGHVMRNFRINKWLYQSGWFIEKNQQVGVFGVWFGTIKDLTIENVTVNGMDGVDGQQTSTWFTGGVVGYFTGNMSNVTVKHVFIKSLSFLRQNIGGLIGYAQGSGNVENCNATDIHVRGSQQGGLIGSLQGNYTVKNCSVDYVYLRATSETQSNLGAFIGDLVEGNGKVIEKCKVGSHVELVLDETGSPLPYNPKNKYYGECRKNESEIKITE